MAGQERVLPATAHVTPSGLSVPESPQLTIVSGKGADGLAKRMRSMSEREVEQWQTQRAGYDTEQIVRELVESVDRVNSQVVDREEVLIQTLFALMTREHQLIYSRAGTGKTLLAKSVFEQFDNSDIFSIQMTKGTPEEALVGGVKIDELKQGKVVHNTDGSVVDARFAFFDEVFDANDVTLRSLLGILNERRFNKGEQNEEAMLHTAIAATNYVRSSDVTEAVVDRFAFRAFIDPSDDPLIMYRADEAYRKANGKAHKPEKKIPFDHVEYIADIVEGEIPGKEITSPPHILFLKNELIREYVAEINQHREEGKKLYISPRTIVKTRDALNASALLHNRQKTTRDDLDALRYMITTIGTKDEDQTGAFRRAQAKVSTISVEDLKDVDRLLNTNELIESIIEARELKKPLDTKFTENLRLLFGLTDINSLTFGRIRAVIENINPTHERVIQLKNTLIERTNKEAQRYDSAGKYNPSILL